MSTLRRTFVASFVLCCAATAAAQTAAPHRISAERLRRLDALLDRYVQEDRIPGAVVLLLQDGKPVYERAFGWADKEAGRRMTPDTIFRIASQTKALTSASILMLVEEGRIGLTEPVGNFIPSFKKTTVAEAGSGPDGGLRVVPAKRAITIHDLLTHTAGISYGTEPLVASIYREQGLGPAAGWGWYTADKDESVCATMDRLGTLPFVAQPGEKYVYGYNIDILGCVVERASGMPFDQFIESRITGPLQMKDTRFFLRPADRARFAAVYASAPGGGRGYQRAADDARGQGHYVEGPRRNFAGGAGLTSTARDYARFLECIRRDGELDGVRILSPRTARLMHTNMVGTLFTTPGMGFGYGFDVAERYGARGLAGAGSYGWGGAYGTSYQVDPESGLVVVFMQQLMPNSTDVQAKVLNLIYQAVD